MIGLLDLGASLSLHDPWRSRRSNRRLGFGSEEHELVRATRARPRGGGRLPAAARAPLAGFRLEPVEENTATRVPERARVGTGPRFREMRASLGPTHRPIVAHDGACDRRTVNTAASKPKGVSGRQRLQEHLSSNASALCGPNCSPRHPRVRHAHPVMLCRLRLKRRINRAAQRHAR